MTSGFESVLKALSNRDLVLPYFDAAILADNWPMEYNIPVDSSPYYGAGDGYFHPSTHPLMGERELYYRFHPETASKMVPERRSVQGEMTLVMGSAGHAVLQTQMEMCGLVTSADVEVEYVNRAHHVRGRIDWIVNHPDGNRYPVEFKTRTHYKFHKQDEPEPSWVAQLNLGMDSQDADLGIILMMESAWPWRMVEFRVNRDHNLLDQIYTKFDRVRQAITDNNPPRHCCELSSKEMKVCPARYECWQKEN